MNKIYVDKTIYTTSNKYGYQININNPTINRLWRNYKNNHNIPPHMPPTDKERFDFEKIIFKMIDSDIMIIKDD